MSAITASSGPNVAPRGPRFDLLPGMGAARILREVHCPAEPDHLGIDLNASGHAAGHNAPVAVEIDWRAAKPSPLQKPVQSEI
jgi:hypothetical protein